MYQQPNEIKSKFIIDGVPSDNISVLDRGLQYGDGLFETIAIIKKQAADWEQHITRLKQGCERLKIPVPDSGQLKGEAELLIKSVPEDQKCVLKIIYTRGVGGRGYRPPEAASPTRILSLSPWPEYPDMHRVSGITLRLCAQRLGNNSTLAGLKHLNRLEQVLARMEWSDPAIAEGLMLDQQDFVTEGTMSNVFFVHNNVLCTPLLTQCGVSGIMRNRVLELAKKVQIKTSIDNFSYQDILQADEIFMTNSLISIWPVKTILSVDQDTHFSAPGELTLQLQSLLENNN